MPEIKLYNEWKNWLAPEFDAPYMQSLRQFLVEEKQNGKVIYPQSDDIFNALNTTAPESVKVVILGQDPYHGPNQAHGLCFSVNEGTALPPSLKNIYKELEQDLGLHMSGSGYLQSWAEQGVLLLNSVLTVEAGLAASHQGKGWETFTDKIIQLINERCEHIVFILWGGYAQKKAKFVDVSKHLVLKSPHPSPLSAHRGFFGNGHFSQTNQYLLSKSVEPINWQV